MASTSTTPAVLSGGARERRAGTRHRNDRRGRTGCDAARSSSRSRSLISSPASCTPRHRGRSNQAGAVVAHVRVVCASLGNTAGPVDAAAAEARLEQDRRAAGARALHVQAAPADVHEPTRPVTPAPVIFGVLGAAPSVRHRHSPPRGSRRARQRQTSRPPPDSRRPPTWIKTRAPGSHAAGGERHASRRRAYPPAAPAASHLGRRAAGTERQPPRLGCPAAVVRGRRQEPLTSQRAPCRPA